MPRWPRVGLLSFALTLAPAACASSGSGAGSGSPAGTRTSYDRNRIGPEEIAQAAEQNVTTVYDLVRSRRPAWMRSNPVGITSGAMSQVMVWLDNNRLGGFEALRNVPLSIAASIRYLSPPEAQAELGLDNSGGAILVVTRR